MIVGVAGAGTMGAGIAALAAGAGLRTLLHVPDPAARERAPEGPERAPARSIARCAAAASAWARSR